MADPASSLAALHERLREEYYALVKVVSEFDGRLVTVKGWSVTLSLAGLGLGFQQEHYALFGLAAATALGFWFIDASMKRHQMQYYSRMRDIEVLAHQLARDEAADPSSPLGTDAARFSSPRIDWYWASPGTGATSGWNRPAGVTPPTWHGCSTGRHGWDTSCCRTPWPWRSASYSSS